MTRERGCAQPHEEPPRITDRVWNHRCGSRLNRLTRRELHFTRGSPPKYRRIVSAVRVASACVVRVAFGPPSPFASAELSATNSLLTHRASALASRTESSVLEPIRIVRVAVNHERRLVDPVDFRGAQRRAGAAPPFDEELAVGDSPRRPVSVMDLDPRHRSVCVRWKVDESYSRFVTRRRRR